MVGPISGTRNCKQRAVVSRSKSWNCSRDKLAAREMCNRVMQERHCPDNAEIDGNNCQHWKLRVDMHMKALLLVGAVSLHTSECVVAEITDEASVEASLDANVDNILFYFWACACKDEAGDIVRNVSGEPLRRCVNPLKEGMLGFRDDMRRFTADFKEETVGWRHMRNSVGSDASR